VDEEMLRSLKSALSSQAEPAPGGDAADKPADKKDA